MCDVANNLPKNRVFGAFLKKPVTREILYSTVMQSPMCNLHTL